MTLKRVVNEGLGIRSFTTSSQQLSTNDYIFVAGHTGMVGSAVVRKLHKDGYKNIITRSSTELDLTDQQAVREFFKSQKVDYVVLAAAKVGGIYANHTYPAEFIYKNLMIQSNVIHEAYTAGIEKLLFLGSSCIYPKFAPQPMREEHLLTGILEPTNEPYAIAKIAGIKMCESYNRQYGTSYRSVMPTNLYGPGDNYHLENSHVIPAMIRKFHLAKLSMLGNLEGIKKDETIYGSIPQDIQNAIGYSSSNCQLQGSKTGNHKSVPKVTLWGSGKAHREFLHVDDMADACTFVMGLDQSCFSANGTINTPRKESETKTPNRSKTSFLNVGTGIDQTIAETAQIIQEVVGYTGEVVYDSHKPDGAPKKLLETSRINKLGWNPKFTLKKGLQDAYESYKERLDKNR